MSNDAATLKNGPVLPQKAKHRAPTGRNNSTPKYVPKRTENTGIHQNLYRNDHISTLSIITKRRKNQNINQLVNGLTNIVHPYDRVLLSHEKE